MLQNLLFLKKVYTKNLHLVYAYKLLFMNIFDLFFLTGFFLCYTISIIFRKGDIMPFIDTKTTANVTDEKREALKTLLGKAIELIPGKSEKWLMLSFEDGVKMYFAGDDSADTAYIEVKIFGSAEDEYYEALTKEITKIFNEVLSIAPDRIYVKYEECYHWGWNGKNF